MVHDGEVVDGGGGVDVRGGKALARSSDLSGPEGGTRGVATAIELGSDFALGGV